MAPPSPAPPFSSSTFVGATHLSLTTVFPPLSPSVLISHNPVNTWVSTTGEAPTPQGRTTPLEGVAEENKILTLHPQSV
ncbi:hypothetical protein CMV_004635 [Castanea mollissima]|uniref:Uncharacterized protein n=1 Tax=Castanea mollissima TaxID=60419 RepID=A0A8J4RF35_9ROSI|nr:hypothetical protein CMV_004635 [Castanea mollissima]